MYVFSITFWILILAVALVHDRVGHRLQRLLLLVTSLVVYGSFGLDLLIVVVLVILITWIGIRARHFTDDRAMLRFARVVTGFAAFLPLITLRYADSAVAAAAQLANRTSLIQADWSLSPLVPIGAAFFTLQAVEGLFAAHRRPLGDDPRFTDHALFVCFFPTVFVGPVQRAESLLPQLQRRRRVTAVDLDAAALLILFGAFQKLLVADNLLPIADRVFAQPTVVSGPEVVIAALAFGIGIVADLAGYTLAVMGVARLFGVHLTPNVNRPYLARSPIEFWDRWNLSVTDWMLRYVFIPLGGQRHGRTRTVLALGLTFLVGAMWYGDRLNLVIWGGIHFFAVLANLLVLRRAKSPPSVTRQVLTGLLTFSFVTYSWVWFRAASIGDALRLHLRLPSVEISSGVVGSAFAIVLFGGLLVASDLVRAAMMSAPTPATGRLANALASPAARGTVIAFAIAGIFVFSTADLHRSVLGLR